MLSTDGPPFASFLARIAPKPGESVLDLGSPTEALADALRSAGAQVARIDARSVDEYGLDAEAAYDAIVSADAMPWVRHLGALVRGVGRSLVPGGRFVMESDRALRDGPLAHVLHAALRRRGVDPGGAHPWLTETPVCFEERVVHAGMRIASLVREPVTRSGELVIALTLTAASSTLLPAGARPGFLQEVAHGVRPALAKRDVAASLGLERLVCVAYRRPR